MCIYLQRFQPWKEGEVARISVRSLGSAGLFLGMKCSLFPAIRSLGGWLEGTWLAHGKCTQRYPFRALSKEAANSHRLLAAACTNSHSIHFWSVWAWPWSWMASRTQRFLAACHFWLPHSSYSCTLAVCGISLKAVSLLSLFPVYTGSRSSSSWLWHAVMLRTVWIHPQVLRLWARANENDLCSLHLQRGRVFSSWLLREFVSPSLPAWLHLPAHCVGFSLTQEGKGNFSFNWHPREGHVVGEEKVVCSWW